MKHQMRRILMAGVLSLPLCVAASTVTTQSNQSQQTSLQASSANQVQTQQQGQQWGLSDEDWSRYQSLMKGARGIMSRTMILDSRAWELKRTKPVPLMRGGKV
ncbi:hypothetical protein J7X69_004108 [Serratia marcescens]